MDILLERIVECIGPKHGAKKELAEHLGIHPNVITNWLNGRNKSYRRYVNEIASFYGVSVNYLLGESDQKEKAALPKENGKVSEIMKLFVSLPEDKQAQALDFLRFLSENANS